MGDNDVKEFKTALIVGAGSGLSASLARALGGAGLQLALAARTIDDLAGLQRGSSVAEDEIAKPQAPRAVTARQLHRGVEREQRWDAVGGGGGIAQVAGDGAAVLNLDRADLTGRRLEPVETGRKFCFDDLGPGRSAADMNMIFGKTDAFQVVNLGKIDEACRRRAIDQSGKNVGPARDQHSAMGRENLDRLLQCPRLEEHDSLPSGWPNEAGAAPPRFRHSGR